MGLLPEVMDLVVEVVLVQLEITLQISMVLLVVLEYKLLYTGVLQYYAGGGGGSGHPNYGEARGGR